VPLTVVAAALIMIGGWSMRGRNHAHPLMWAAWPVGATAVIIALDLLSHDASAAAQIFLIFPVLYAASQLRRPGVVVIVISLVAAEWVITFGHRFEVGDGRFVSVTISGGLAHAPTDAVDLRSLYAADRALYRAKHLGRDQIHAASTDAHRDDVSVGTAGSDDLEPVDVAVRHRLDDGRVAQIGARRNT
jgi:hypothetical protein